MYEKKKDSPGELWRPTPLHSTSLRMTLVTLALGAYDEPMTLLCICDVVTTRWTVYIMDDCTFGGDGTDADDDEDNVDVAAEMVLFMCC